MNTIQSFMSLYVIKKVEKAIFDSPRDRYKFPFFLGGTFMVNYIYIYINSSSMLEYNRVSTRLRRRVSWISKARKISNK